MSVYIDPQTKCLPNGAYRWREVTHLFADTERELHEFAARIGLKRGWHQVSNGGLSHYDLNHGRRKFAVAEGAQELSGAALLVKWSEIKTTAKGKS